MKQPAGVREKVKTESGNNMQKRNPETIDISWLRGFFPAGRTSAVQQVHLQFYPERRNAALQQTICRVLKSFLCSETSRGKLQKRFNYLIFSENVILKLPQRKS